MDEETEAQIGLLRCIQLVAESQSCDSDLGLLFKMPNAVHSAGFMQRQEDVVSYAEVRSQNGHSAVGRGGAGAAALENCDLGYIQWGPPPVSILPEQR